MLLRDILTEYASPAIGCLIVILNIVEIFFIFKTKAKKPFPPAMLLILNLAFSDLFVGCVICTIKILTPFDNNKTTISDILDLLHFLILRISLFVSVLNLTSLTVLRMLAVKKPVVSNKLKQSLVIKLCYAIWLIPLFVMIIIYIIVYAIAGKETYVKHIDIMFPVITYPALVIFIICYVLIIKELGTRKAKMKGFKDPRMESAYRRISNAVQASPSFLSVQEYTRQQPPVECDNKTHVNNTRKVSNLPKVFVTQIKSNRSTENIMILAWRTVILFQICWFPFTTFCLVNAACECPWPHMEDLRLSLITLTFFNSVIDPLLYFSYVMRNEKARKLSRQCAKMNANMISEEDIASSNR